MRGRKEREQAGRRGQGEKKEKSAGRKREKVDDRKKKGLGGKKARWDGGEKIFLIFIFFQIHRYWIRIRESQINAIIHVGPDFETLFCFSLLTIHVSVADSWQKFPISPSEKKFGS
jgi:hypothetical protein